MSCSCQLYEKPQMEYFQTGKHLQKRKKVEYNQILKVYIPLKKKMKEKFWETKKENYNKWRQCNVERKIELKW